MKYAGIGCLVLLVLGVLIIGGSVVSGYNSLVALDQAAQQAWEIGRASCRERV